MRYVVLMNMKYLNSFRYYGDAVDYRDYYQKKYPEDMVEIITYAGWEQVPPNNNWQLVNEMHIYDACYVNDTVIVNGYDYNWRIWDGPVPPPEEEKKKKFPWVLYARKFRNRANV